jgi:hypothetical protein
VKDVEFIIRKLNNQNQDMKNQIDELKREIILRGRIYARSK